MLVDLVEDEAAPGDPDRRCSCWSAPPSVYLLVLSGLHAWPTDWVRDRVPARSCVVAALWVIALLGLDAGTSVLLIGLALAAQPRRLRTPHQPRAPSAA